MKKMSVRVKINCIQTFSHFSFWYKNSIHNGKLITDAV